MLSIPVRLCTGGFVGVAAAVAASGCLETAYYTVCACGVTSVGAPWSDPHFPDTFLEATMVVREGVWMPAAKPPEFRRRAVEPARRGDQPIAQIAKDLGIAECGLRRWMKQASLDEGRRSDGLTSDERKELAELRRRNRTLEMEVEILKRASAYFAQENVLPK